MTLGLSSNHSDEALFFCALSSFLHSLKMNKSPLPAARKLPGQQGYRLRQWHNYMGSLTNIKLQYGWWAILLD